MRDHLGWLGILILVGCQSRPAGPVHRPVIDSHVHINPDPASVERVLKLFAENGIDRFCTKSAGYPGTVRYRETVALQQKLGERMAFFINTDWNGIDDPGWGEREAQRLEFAVRQGARGIKFFKSLGLSVRTADGKLLAIDDQRLDPIFRKAQELGAIIAIHTADPKTFFDPPTPDNERYHELLFAPSWGFYGEDFPSKKELLATRDRLFDRYPKLSFLGIHLANSPEDLEYVDRLLDAHPNLTVDTSARVPEFGRHPGEKVRAFFVKHQDRILFGSDIVISAEHLQLGSLSIWPEDDLEARRFYDAHWAYFESDRRGLETPTPIQGNWTIDAIHLPSEVLEKIYRTNAERLIWKKS